MARVKEWSDEEVSRLNKLYTSNKAFDEIILEFPFRTSNAIRLKASRMGLKRPTLPVNLIQAERVRYHSLDGDGAIGYLIKCSECGSWIQAEMLSGTTCQTISCSECGALHEVLSDS